MENGENNYGFFDNLIHNPHFWTLVAVPAFSAAVGFATTHGLNSAAGAQIYSENSGAIAGAITGLAIGVSFEVGVRDLDSLKRFGNIFALPLVSALAAKIAVIRIEVATAGNTGMNETAGWSLPLAAGLMALVGQRLHDQPYLLAPIEGLLGGIAFGLAANRNLAGIATTAGMGLIAGLLPVVAHLAYRENTD